MRWQRWREKYFEARTRHHDGHYVNMEIRARLLNDSQGKVIGAIWAARDITKRLQIERDRKRAEAALQESEKYFKEITENSSDIIIITDKSGKIQYCSRSIERFTGYKPEELIGRIGITLIHPDDVKRALSDYGKVILSMASATPNSFRIVRKDGAVRYFEGLGKNLLDNPAVEGFIMNIRDITERKQAEEKLDKEKQRFRILSDQSSDIILLINREKTIIYENSAVEKIVGLKREERIGKNVLENLHPDDLHIVINTFDALIGDSNANSQRGEIRIRHADGSWLTFEVVASNLTHENITEAIIVNLHDITERKKAEEKLHKTLESLRKAVGTTIQVLVSAVESRDSYTAGHQSRSADLACAIAKEMGLAPDKIEGIRMAGSIHDIGKLSIPAELLSKPTKLTDIEFALIKEHSRSGYEMLKDVESPWPLAEIVYQHHERMNGSGYPRNLKGDEIIIESQILAVADVVEAMASHRPYRPTLGIEAALEEITKNKGILYNNAVADACLRLFREKGYQLT